MNGSEENVENEDYDFRNLAPEMVQEILLNLPPKDLTRACSSNKELVNICADESFISTYYRKYKKEIEERKRSNPKEKDEIIEIIKKAVIRGDIKLYKKWMNYPDWDPAVDGNFTIKKAAEKGLVRAVKLLLEDKRINPAADNNYAIQMASANGHAPVVRLLLNFPYVPGKLINPAADDNYALRMASTNGHAEVVKLLLAEDVDASADDHYALEIACSNGHFEVVKLLLAAPKKKKVRPDAHNNFSIQVAAQNGHTKIVRLLLEDPRIDKETKEKYKKFEKLVVKLKTVKMSIKDIPNVSDIINLSTPSAEEWLAEDEDNIIFIYEGEASGITRSDLKKATGIDDEKYYFECKEKNKGLVVPPKNIYEDNPYIIIGLPTVYDKMNIYITLPEAEALFESKARVFTFKKTGKVLKYTASNQVVQRGPGINHKGEQINVSSADHCQDMSDKETYTPYVVNISD